MDFYARRIAGTVHTLNAGYHPNLNRGSSADSWNAVKSVEAETIVTKNSGYRVKLWFEVIAGPWAGEDVYMICSNKGLWVLGRHAGFSKYTPQLQMWSHDEAVGMMFSVFISNKENSRWGPTLEHWGVTSSQHIHNRALIRERRMLPCSMYNMPKNCSSCAMGLDKCKFGLRRFTWYKAKCKFCGNESWHNPRDGDICVECKASKLKALFMEYRRNENT